MKKLTGIILLSLHMGLFAIAQSTIGLPTIRSYRNTDYHADRTVWDMARGKNGLLYFANNDGLLTFDGVYWRTYPLPHSATIKSLAIDSSGKVYVGGQDEIGYFSPDPQGSLSYHSLKELLPPVARQFADIWNIVVWKDHVFFRTIESIYEWRDGRMYTHDAPGGWRLLAQAGSNLYADDKLNGLLRFDDGKWVAACDKYPTVHITGILEYNKDTLLVTTLKDGLYLLADRTLLPKPTPVDPLLKRSLINSARQLDPSRYAICTAAGGLFIIDHYGRLIQRYSTAEGLPNNNVLNVFSDHSARLWLGLENGIASIDDRSPFTHIYPVKDNQLRTNAIKIFDRHLFIGTSNGLYSLPLDSTPLHGSPLGSSPLHGTPPDSTQKDISKMTGAFTEVANTNGEVWSLEDIDHTLFEGHRDGVFLIRGNKAIPISTGQGVWDCIGLGPTGSPGAAAKDREIIASTYTGLRWIKKVNGEFHEGNKLNDLYESLPRIALDDNNTIWASQSHRSVFSNPIDTQSHYKHYTRAQGLPSDLNNYVYSIDHHIVVATEKGVYEYAPSTDRFIPSPRFAPILDTTAVEYLCEDADHNIWFVSNGRVGVVDHSKPSSGNVLYFPELTSHTVKGSACIYPYDRENIFFASDNGVIHLNYENYVAAPKTINIILGAANVINKRDSHFEYASPDCITAGNIQFSYRLTGFDNEWSAWSDRTEKDYTNLPHGTYTFSVRAKDNLGNISQPAEYTFSVPPRWYQTIWAWLLYLVAAVLAIILLRRIHHRRLALHRKKHEEEQVRLQYLHKLELDRQEKKLIELQNAKLEDDLRFKDKELASVTMHLVERSNLLSSIREELLAVIKKLNIAGLPYELRNVFKMLGDPEKNDDDWHRFALYFDQVHNNFLSTLKSKFPLLSATDLKLCAYIRLNLSSKEIAQILNISLKGVEVSRYRIRKKLSLPTETNLYEFLLTITNPTPPTGPAPAPKKGPS